jgi:hypothetical protein
MTKTAQMAIRYSVPMRAECRPELSGLIFDGWFSMSVLDSLLEPSPQTSTSSVASATRATASAASMRT